MGGQVCAWALRQAQASRAAQRPAERGRGSIAGNGVALLPLRAVVGGAGAARQGHHGAIMG